MIIFTDLVCTPLIILRPRRALVGKREKGSVAWAWAMTAPSRTMADAVVQMMRVMTMAGEIGTHPFEQAALII